MNKDQSIITQVAAKIAADLTPKTNSVDENIVSWVAAFDAVREALFMAHEESPTPTTAVPTASPAVTQQANEQTMLQQAFPTAQPVSHQIRVKGKQHGPLPEWLIAACQRDGVTELWDNRDGLQANPKRPWFKATSGDKAYWPPRS